MRWIALPAVLVTLLHGSALLGQQETPIMDLQEQSQATQKPIDVEVEGERKSPAWSQSRTYSTTRMWRLDPGEQSGQIWYTLRLKKDGVSGKNPSLWQLEYEVGVVKGLQFDAYFNYGYDKDEGPHIEGASLETRIAPWDYGQIWGNPVLYLEFKGQTRAADRAEARILLGGELGLPKLRGGVNAFYEQNVDSATGDLDDYELGIETGASAAISYAIVPEYSVGIEGRLAAEQQGAAPDNPDAFQSVLKVGPSMWFNLAEGHFFIVATMLAGMTEYSDALATTLVLGVR
jgi:hypothetical protein